MLKIGVVGAGHLGKIHLNCINQLSEFELIGFYDTDPEVIETVQKEYQIKAFDSISALIEATDVIDIVTPTLSHFECAKQAIVASKHIFIEKPITNTTDEAKSIISLAYNYFPENTLQEDRFKISKYAYGTDYHFALKYKLKDGTLNDAGEMAGEVFLEYGTFLTNVIDFIIVAFVMFMVVKGVNKMKKKEEPAPEAPAGPSQEDLLTEIRDLLKK